MRILVIGNGGREHALIWKLAFEKSVSKLFCDGKSDAINMLADNLDINYDDFPSIAQQVLDNNIDLVIIGGETLLSLGLCDYLREKGINCLGPNKQGAQLESSKIFTRHICEKYDIPSVKFVEITNNMDVNHAVSLLDQFSPPFVIKADGLAAGKGVSITSDRKEAEEIIKANLSGANGENAKNMLVEEFMEGKEVSFFALCDGDKYCPLFSAQDYKRAFDNDKGPNTGGMGSIAPSPIIDENDEKIICEEFVAKTLRALKAENIHYNGILYVGLMKTSSDIASGFKLVEYNVRFGDPECQLFTRMLGEDIAPFFYDCAKGNVPTKRPLLKNGVTALLVYATKGYPSSYEKGSEIKNLLLPSFENLHHANDIVVFHAGTKITNEKIYANGGRVLNITAFANNYEQAREKIYQQANEIEWSEGFFRSDIAKL